MAISPRKRVSPAAPDVPVDASVDASGPVVEEALSSRSSRWRGWLAIVLLVVAGVGSGYAYRSHLGTTVASVSSRMTARFSRASWNGAQKTAATSPAVVVPVVVDSTCIMAVEVRADQLARLAVAGVVDPSMMSPDSLPSWPALPCPQRLDSLTALLADQVVASELYTPGEHGEMIEKPDAELRRLASIRKSRVLPARPAAVR